LKFEMQIKVDIPDELLEHIAQSIPEENLPELIVAAFGEWVAWFNGSFRPMSISELETRRVFDLYDRVLVDEVPSAERLGELLGLPMGRARYVMQNLAYRHGRLLRRRQAQAVLSALNGGKWSNDGDSCVVTVDPGCRDLMDRTIRGLAAQGRLESIVRGRTTLEGVRYEMGPNHHAALTEAFGKEAGDRHPGSSDE
jgi:PAS domain-containing protein